METIDPGTRVRVEGGGGYAGDPEVHMGIVLEGPDKCCNYKVKWDREWEGSTESWEYLNSPDVIVCTHETNDIMFVAFLGAPGFGKSFKCECGTEMWGTSKESAVPFVCLDPEDFIMSPDDCI